MASSNDRSRRPSGKPPKGNGSRSGSKPGGGKGSGSRTSSGAGSKGGGSKGKPGSGSQANRGGQGYRERSAAEKQGSGGRTSGGAPRKYTKSAGKPKGRNVPDEPIPGNRAWGGLARKGALRATHDEQREHDEERRLRDGELDPEQLAKRAERERRRAEREQRTADLRAEARVAVERASESKPPRPSRPKRPKPPLERPPLGSGRARNEDEVTALNRLLGPHEAKKQIRKLKTAATSFEAERYSDARKSLKAIAELAPSVPEVRELYGLTLYRMGNYREAAKQLEAFRELAASADQNPVLADCYRAQQRWADVDELWRELAEVSPGAALVNEGRIVMAGSLADQGDIDGAVRLLEKGWKRPSKPHDHHLRRAYALADLYERSGDLPRARALFDWVVAHDRDFVDARRRLQHLR